MGDFRITAHRLAISEQENRLPVGRDLESSSRDSFRKEIARIEAGQIRSIESGGHAIGIQSDGKRRFDQGRLRLRREARPVRASNDPEKAIARGCRHPWSGRTPLRNPGGGSFKLPLLFTERERVPVTKSPPLMAAEISPQIGRSRSEERRVGKEC